MTDQDPALVTYAAKLTREDRILKFTQPAAFLARQIRALAPAPLAFFEIAGQATNVCAAIAVPLEVPHAPGSIIRATTQGIELATTLGALRVTELQPPGKRPMSARDFLNGYGRILNSDVLSRKAVP